MVSKPKLVDLFHYGIIMILLQSEEVCFSSSDGLAQMFSRVEDQVSSGRPINMTCHFICSTKTRVAVKRTVHYEPMFTCRKAIRPGPQKCLLPIIVFIRTSSFPDVIPTGMAWDTMKMLNTSVLSPWDKNEVRRHKLINHGKWWLWLLGERPHVSNLGRVLCYSGFMFSRLYELE